MPVCRRKVTVIGAGNVGATAAQRIAGIGMDRARALLGDGATAYEVATEAMYAISGGDSEWMVMSNRSLIARNRASKYVMSSSG